MPNDPLATDAVEAVDLSVPTSPELVRLARVTASGLASRLGFTYEEVEDLRLAIDELCYALVGKGHVSGTLRLHYAIFDGSLEIEGTADVGADSDGRSPHLSELSELILDALVDEHSLDVEGLHFRLVKRRV